MFCFSRVIGLSSYKCFELRIVVLFFGGSAQNTSSQRSPMGKQNLSKSSKSVRSLGMQIEDAGASSEASKFQREGVNPSCFELINDLYLQDHCMESTLEVRMQNMNCNFPSP